MSMSELTDDQLDGLFRKSAEEFDPPFDPAAWQDMKTRLDAHDRPTPGGTPGWKNLLRWGLPICLLLLIGGGLYLYRSNADRGSSPHRNTTATQTRKTDAQRAINKARIERTTTGQQQPTDTNLVSAATGSPAVGDPVAGSAVRSVDLTRETTQLTKPVDEPSARGATRVNPLNQLGRPVNTTGQTSTPSTKGETNAPSVAYGQKTSPANHESDRASKALPALVTRSVPKAYRTKQWAGERATKRTLMRERIQPEWQTGNKNRLAMHDAAVSLPAITTRSSRTGFAKGSLAATNNPENANQPMIGQVERAGLPDVHELAIRPADWPKPLVFIGRTIDVPPIEAAPMAVESKTPVDKGLSVRLAIAPDLSSIGLRNFARPGTNVGALLEYRLAPRWSVQTGIIQSTKIYRASAADYELRDYYKNGMYTIPQGADGQCKMLDIPINVRYDVLLKPRTDGRAPSRWFVSGGVTSYIIEREDYVYKYTGYVHKAVPDWSGKSGSYGFSQLNVSVGYERALTKRLSWQIEPFVKMPLKGVGYLNLNLLSTGTFFSIRYKL